MSKLSRPVRPRQPLPRTRSTPQVVPMRKADRGSSAMVHAMDLAGKDPSSIANGRQALCGTTSGWRSAGWTHCPGTAITCPGCRTAATRLVSDGPDAQELSAP